MYLVTRKNQVIDYCEQGYALMGSNIVCPSKNCKFENATVVYTETPLPEDIDTVVYGYINGIFLRVCDKEKDTESLYAAIKELRETKAPMYLWGTEDVSSVSGVKGQLYLQIVEE